MKNGLDANGDYLNEEIEFLSELIKSTPPEQVAYAIIRGFCDEGYEASPEVRAQFNKWITDTTEAKEKALERYFYEICEEQMPKGSSEKACDILREFEDGIGLDVFETEGERLQRVPAALPD